MANHHANNFDLLRVTAAVMVVASHSYPVVGAPEPTPALNPLGGTWGNLGVLIFFSISGYLIALSWASDPDLKRFFARRALRIVPGLALVAALTALVLGPFVTSIPLGDYFTSIGTWAYIPTTAIGVLPSPDPPGLFSGQPSPAINASLWTIPFEIACYAGVAGLGLLGLLRPQVLGLLVLAGALLANPRLVTLPTVLPKIALDALPFAVAFFAAALIALERRRIRFVPWIAAAAFAVSLALRSGPLGPTLAMLAAPYVVLTLALGVPKLPSGPLERWDLSYGLYLFAFPVQQTVHLATGATSPWLVTAVTLTIITPLALASWLLVESRALRFKPSRPAGEAAAEA